MTHEAHVDWKYDLTPQYVLQQLKLKKNAHKSVCKWLNTVAKSDEICQNMRKHKNNASYEEYVTSVAAAVKSFHELSKFLEARNDERNKEIDEMMEKFKATGECWEELKAAWHPIMFVFPGHPPKGHPYPERWELGKPRKRRKQQHAKAK